MLPLVTNCVTFSVVLGYVTLLSVAGCRLVAGEVGCVEFSTVTDWVTFSVVKYVVVSGVTGPVTFVLVEVVGRVELSAVEVAVLL